MTYTFSMEKIKVIHKHVSMLYGRLPGAPLRSETALYKCSTLTGLNIPSQLIKYRPFVECNYATAFVIWYVVKHKIEYDPSICNKLRIMMTILDKLERGIKI